MLNQIEVDLVKEIYYSVPCYRTIGELEVLLEASKTLPENPKILIIGPGIGIETILLKKYFIECEIEVVDIWEEHLRFKNYFNNNSNLKEKYASQFLYNCRDQFEENCLKLANFLPIINQTSVYDFEISKKYNLIYWDQGCQENKIQENKTLNLFNKFYDHLLDNGILFGCDYFYKHDPKLTVLANTQLSFLVNEFCENRNLELFCDKNRNLSYWYVKKL